MNALKNDPPLIFLYFQSRSHYEKALKESEKAMELYRKTDEDMNATRADVWKVEIFIDHIAGR